MQSRMVALYTVLSQHAPNEHYLSDDDQGLIYVRPCMMLLARVQSCTRDRVRRSAVTTACVLALLVVCAITKRYVSDVRVGL